MNERTNVTLHVSNHDLLTLVCNELDESQPENHCQTTIVAATQYHGENMVMYDVEGHRGNTDARRVKLFICP